MPRSPIVYSPRDFSRASRRRVRWRAILFLLASLTLGAAAALLWYLPSWQIEAVEIFGVQTLSEERLKITALDLLNGEILFFIPKRTSLLFNTEAFAEKFRSASPRIASLAVTKEYPKTLKISLTERKLWGIACGNATTTSLGEPRCVYLDTTGFAYEPAPDSSGMLITKVITDGGKIRVGAQLLVPELVEKLDHFAGALRRETGLDLVSYDLSQPLSQEFQARTSAGFTLSVNREDDLAEVAKILKRVLDEEVKTRRSQLEYVDLRFGNKVFYKLRSQR